MGKQTNQQLLKIVAAIFLLVQPIVSNASQLTVYTYDSFSAKGALGAYLKTEFEKKENQKVEYVVFGSAGEALNQVFLEGKRTRADLVIGVDQTQLDRLNAKFDKLPDALFEKIPKNLRVDPNRRLLPFNHGYLAFLYDSKRTTVPPVSSLKELSTIKSLRKKIVIQDPRTSSIGLNFLLWTRHLFPDDKNQAFWKQFKKQLITVSPSWSASYGMFVKGQADLVLSYSTSPAYHRKEDPKSSIRAIVFKEGHFHQLEGVSLLSTSKQKSLAIEFMKLLLSSKVQAEVPKRNWMLPVVEGVSLPNYYTVVPKVSALKGAKPVSAPELKGWLKQWREQWVP